jgi:hypothetical protein
LVGTIPVVSTVLSGKEKWEHIKCRLGGFRHSYKVEPGLYAVGSPDSASDVLVSANYKMSFDVVRRELAGMNAWILVLDTNGINVWCAAGKGTFGTDELVKRIKSVQLDKIINHKRIIVPQLGAVGVSAYQVTKATCFRISFGPVHIKDIHEFIKAGYKATQAMRRIEFSIKDRLILTPVELNPVMIKFVYFALAMLAIFGLGPTGILFEGMLSGGLPFVGLGLVAVFSGAFLTPVLLPYIPFRSFALKGLLTGILSTLLSMKIMNVFAGSVLLSLSALIFFPVASSYLALQFTGASTYTSPSGVNKELKIGLPVYMLCTLVSSILIIAYKIINWSAL